MATPGRKLDESTRRWILRASQVMSIKAIAREGRLSKNTVKKVVRGLAK